MSKSRARDESLDIAVVGAGIAGLVFAIACHNLGLKVTVYEAAHEIHQHGSGIALTANSILALKLVDERLLAELSKLDMPMAKGQGCTFNYRLGQDCGSRSALDLVQDIPHDRGTMTVHRVSYIRLLASFVPDGTIQFSKRLTSLQKLGSGQVRLLFQDGTQATHDLVVGGDGIRSKVRQYVLGKSSPDAVPRFTGKVCHRVTVDVATASDYLDENLLESPTIYMGEGGHMAVLPVDQGKRLTVFGIASRPSWNHEKWDISTTKEELKADYANFDDRLSSLLSQAENVDLSALFHMPDAATFVNGNVVIMGDAAHSSTPFQGSGSSMALEDAYILANLLAQAMADRRLELSDFSGMNRIQAALRAYDTVRRPRSLRQVQTAYENGLILDLESPKFGHDIEAIAEDMRTRYQWIYNVDLEAELAKAIDLMRSLGVSQWQDVDFGYQQAKPNL